MNDAELIYHACLRTERELEIAVRQGSSQPVDAYQLARDVLAAIQTLRQEIGRGLAERVKQNPGEMT